MIIVTGTAGFIGSQLVHQLNKEGFKAIIAVDKFDREDKNKNLEGAQLFARVDRDNFFEWLDEHYEDIEFCFHLGARTDTTEFNRELLWQLNTEYSKEVWKRCEQYQIPLVYASSAATYGLGEHGYIDSEEVIPRLKPLNPYGESKNEFDEWAIKQESKPFYWAGLKFFNVYGPGEYHKGRMASVIWHAYNQIKTTEKMKLFRSHRPDFKDGEQERDFVYVKDVCAVCMWLLRHRKDSGIYNLGTGKARSFNDLAKAVFSALGKEANIEYIDTPMDIRDKYQYFTEADMSKLRSIGYDKPFTSLEDGVKEYVEVLKQM